ncbi:MAG: type II toxin-antitoxin system RelE/ParE family toxin [Candidatus Sedimenticola sp. (ex Thyasira tokunagai)]
MQIFKSRSFNRWAKKERLTDEVLKTAVKELGIGLVDADLGGNVYKKRIGLAGRGKRAGVRTLIAFHVGNKAFFLYGFGKNVRANISNKELKSLRLLAGELLGYTDKALTKAVEAKELIEVLNDDD